MLMFTLLRMGMFFYVVSDHSIFSKPNAYACFIHGLRFDHWVLCYVLAAPVVVLFILEAMQRKSNVVWECIRWYLTLVISLSFVFALADIPYFHFFHNRLTEASFQWMEFAGTGLQMIWDDASHRNFLLLALFGAIGIGTGTALYLNKQRNTPTAGNRNRVHLLISFLVTGVLLFSGMRGKWEHPLMTSDAQYTNNPVLNQIPLNTLFTIFKSYTARVRLMNDEDALKYTCEYLGIHPSTKGDSPVAREIYYEGPVRKPNIVLVLMEGMSASYLGRSGRYPNLTPVLDSLSTHALYFTQARSAGIHTNNGIFSTLYSYPALRRLRPMQNIPVRSYYGWPQVLKEQGYSTSFFCVHSRSFDNIGEFIPTHGFDSLYSSEQFPPNESLGAFGVPDAYMFGRAVQQLSQTRPPFFATLLTASNHDPYTIPANFKTSFHDKELKAVAYADYAIGELMKEASRQAWFQNSIFVFVADHGRRVGESSYDLDLSFNHIPILFYSPSGMLPVLESHEPMGQIDVFPTMMGLLHISFVNNTLGCDILHQKRPAMYFSADDRLACINNRFLYLYRYNGGETLHELSANDNRDVKERYPETFDFLRNYALSQTQCAEFLLRNNLTTRSK